MLLDQKKAVALLEKYSIFSPKTYILNNANELSQLKIDFPAVLKVDSQQAIHKSDLGLVFTNLNGLLEIKSKMDIAENILREKNISTYKFIIQEMIKGTELIIGMKTDKTFGKVILFGLGGVFVEVLKDVSMRIAPLTKKDCIEMIEETKGKKLLEGYRKFPVVSKEKIIDLLLNFSQLCIKEKDLMEIDFNPVIVNEKSAIVVDARIIFGEKYV